jgi:alkylation response protein AidB-like acyl-CoA dehydrogenase
VRLDAAAPVQFDAVIKALAGRNGRRACERALQVLGAIGFTSDHDHHHHHSRVLALDALLGSANQLTPGLGRWLRTTGRDPGFAEAVLVHARP